MRQEDKNLLLFLQITNKRELVKLLEPKLIESTWKRRIKNVTELLKGKDLSPTLTKRAKRDIEEIRNKFSMFLE